MKVKISTHYKNISEHKLNGVTRLYINVIDLSTNFVIIILMTFNQMKLKFNLHRIYRETYVTCQHIHSLKNGRNISKKTFS